MKEMREMREMNEEYPTHKNIPLPNKMTELTVCGDF